MSYASIMKDGCNLLNALACTNTALGAITNGANPTVAITKSLGIFTYGCLRNEIAYDMQCHGNPVGNMVNLYSGYGNTVSNAVGTMGLMSACSPWMFFNCYSYCPPPMNFCSPMAGFGGFGVMGGFWC